MDRNLIGKMGKEERKREGEKEEKRGKLGVVGGIRWPLCLGKGCSCLGRGEQSVECVSVREGGDR